MPVSGHWHMRHRVDSYLEQRAQEVDSTEPGVHVLTPERAVEEWMRLEPAAIGHDRPALHEFFGRTRNCLATFDADSGRATALCWVSGQGEIGPGVGEHPADLVPVVLAALDRVAKMQEPETFGVFCTTASWWLMDRLRRLGFNVHWPAWIMSSVPLPGLDRYLPTRPRADCSCTRTAGPRMGVWDKWPLMQRASCLPSRSWWSRRSCSSSSSSGLWPRSPGCSWPS